MLAVVLTSDEESSEHWQVETFRVLPENVTSVTAEWHSWFKNSEDRVGGLRQLNRLQHPDCFKSVVSKYGQHQSSIVPDINVNHVVSGEEVAPVTVQSFARSNKFSMLFDGDSDDFDSDAVHEQGVILKLSVTLLSFISHFCR